MVKVAIGRMEESLANLCLEASPWFAQVELFLSTCSN